MASANFWKYIDSLSGYIPAVIASYAPVPRIKDMRTLNSSDLKELPKSSIVNGVYSNPAFKGSAASAFLYYDDVGRKHLIISIRGTNADSLSEFRKDAAYWASKEYVQAFMPFLDAIRHKYIDAGIVTTSNVVFTGHSLGGDVVNKLADMKNAIKYSDASYLGFSSPYLSKYAINFGHENDPVYKLKQLDAGSPYGMDHIYYDGFSSVSLTSFLAGHDKFKLQETLSRISDLKSYDNIIDSTAASFKIDDYFYIVDKASAANTTVYTAKDNMHVVGTILNDSIKFIGSSSEIYALKGDDTVNGSFGKDVVFGGAGSDVLSGAGGDDRLHGEDGNDVISGGAGNDRIYGGRGRDTLAGDDGNDMFYADAFAEKAEGEDFDKLYNPTKFDGGKGVDTITFKDRVAFYVGKFAADSSDNVKGDTWVNIEIIKLSQYDDRFSVDQDGLSVYGGAGDDGISAGDVYPHEVYHKANIYGQDGNDSLFASAGLIDGGSGDDDISLGSNVVAIGGEGRDVFYVDRGNSIIKDFTSGVDKIGHFGSVYGVEDAVVDVFRSKPTESYTYAGVYYERSTGRILEVRGAPDSDGQGYHTEIEAVMAVLEDKPAFHLSDFVV